MEARYLKRKNDSGVEERFYPITHADAVIGLRDNTEEFVPNSRTVNGKALASDITLSASDVGARPSTWMPTASDVGAVTEEYVNKEISAVTAKIPIIETGTEDLEAGVSTLPTGTIYLVLDKE